MAEISHEKMNVRLNGWSTRQHVFVQWVRSILIRPLSLSYFKYDVDLAQSSRQYVLDLLWMFMHP
jgi:hypothetical protein